FDVFVCSLVCWFAVVFLFFCFYFLGCVCVFFSFFFFVFYDSASTEIYTLSLHDALPICLRCNGCRPRQIAPPPAHRARSRGGQTDRKSTRLNSSHVKISYAVFCLKKKRCDWG